MSFYSRVRTVCNAQYKLYHAGPGWDPYEHSKWERVRDRLIDCADMAEAMGGETAESFERCLRSFECGAYKLGPDPDGLCLDFVIHGQVGAMIWHRATKTWALHT